MSGEKNFVYGRNPVKERLKMIKSGTLFIKKNINDSFISDILNKAKSKNLNIEFKDSAFFDTEFRDKNHQGIALASEEDFANFITIDDIIENTKDEKKAVVLILDGIEDVGNLGAVIRSALLFNVSAVVLPKNNSAPINDIVAKRSAGAINFIEIAYVTNIVSSLDKLKSAGFWIYGADGGGDKSLPEVEFSDKSVIVMGDENFGIRKLVRENCDFLVNIPTNKKLDSLNLSVSAGIFLYEVNKSIFK
jgi:23S rRNA (guanosine2251-2'-O)-methyltransferase